MIDSDSWRLWPSGDKRLDKSKQVYRDLATVTDSGLQQVKRNFEWVGQQLDKFIPTCKAQVILQSQSFLTIDTNKTCIHIAFFFYRHEGN